MPLSPDHAGRSAEVLPLPRFANHGSLGAALEAALLQAPGQPVVMVRPAPVKVRGATASAIAYTITHVLVEESGAGEYRLRWESSWLVRRLTKDTADSGTDQPS